MTAILGVLAGINLLLAWSFRRHGQRREALGALALAVVLLAVGSFMDVLL